MKYVRLLAAWVAVAFLTAGPPAFAQWQVPQYSIPSGRGGGAIGFDSSAPGTAGLPLVSAGPSAKPVFGPLSSAALPTPPTVLVNGTTTTFNSGQCTGYVARGNSNAPMVDTLPGTGAGVLPAGCVISFKNDDTAPLYALTVAAGATLDGNANGFVLLGPKQAAMIYSDGSNYRSLAPARAKFAPYTVGITSLFFAVTGGSDTRPCILTTAPCATPQAIVDLWYQRIDVGQGQLTIQACAAAAAPVGGTCAAPGSPQTFNITGNAIYARGRAPGIGNPSGSDPMFHAVQFRGDPANPANFTLNATGQCVTAINDATFAIDGFKLVCGGGSAVYAGIGSILGIEHIEYGAVTETHVWADGAGAYVHFDNSYVISGGGRYHMRATNNAQILSNAVGGSTVTNSGTPSFSVAYVSAEGGGILNTLPFTYSGAVNGKRWSTGPYGGVINNTFGTACDSIFPGTVAGSNTGGGQCDGTETSYSNVVFTSLALNAFVRTDSLGKLATYVTCNLGVIVTDGSGAPSCSTTLPNGLAMGTPASINLTNATSYPLANLTGAGTSVLAALAIAIRTNGAFAKLGATATALSFATLDSVRDVGGFASCNNGTVQTNSAGTPACVAIGNVSTQLNADVSLTSTTLYIDGPTLALSSAGIWAVSGGVTVLDTNGAARIQCKLYSGATILDSGESATQGAAAAVKISLSGNISAPAANVTIACRDLANITGVSMKFNQTGNSKDSTLSAYRIGTP